VINYELTIYDSIVSTLCENLLAAKEMDDQSTSIGELRQVTTARNTLREKVTGIKRFLPRAMSKRGLFNIGGTILKHLFGTVTVLELNALHATVEELHQRQDAVTHSLDGHLTYFKQLDESVRFDQQAIHNLSSNIRDFARKTQETFQKVATKLEWSNKLRASATLIRQLEFSLACLESRLDQTLTALQFVVNGKIPVNLISPAEVRDILVNVSLSQPEGYELSAGLPNNDLSWYYMYVY
jgi:chromosome condensin MukBEF ATPase and DNA-binding subunit MukB